jgi:protein-tyrosine phosphatase
MILDCNEVLADRLWVGGFVRPKDVRLLRQMGVTTVVSLQSGDDFEMYNIDVKKLLKAYNEAGIELRCVAIPDRDEEAMAADLEQSVAEVEAALAPNWAKVYLHCTAGINRAPTVAAAYLVRARGLSAQEAYDFVVARRHCSPYLAVLERYEASLKNAR